MGKLTRRDKMVNKIEIGKRLRELRGDKTVEAVSKACGISESAVQMYECGARVSRDEIKIKLAKFFGRSVESIFFTA
jgi:transcriptional regulator with XRE-family HTH domain